MPLHALLPISFLHLILLSFHFLFLLQNVHTAAEADSRSRPEQPNIQSRGPVRCDLTLIHRLPFLVAQSPHPSCGDQWNLIFMHRIDQPPRDLATLYFEIADRLWQPVSWMNEGCCWNRRAQIGQQEAYGIVRGARSEQREKLQGRNQLCSTTLTIRFSQWLSGYLLFARHLFNGPFFDRLPFFHLCHQFVYVAARRWVLQLALKGEEGWRVKYNVLTSRRALCWEDQSISKPGMTDFNLFMA